ncbi:MAG: NAD(+)/NADH kinase [Aquificota bacterium]|nr:NAD(+)/NADH kinase [Aquificota bacterium]
MRKVLLFIKDSEEARNTAVRLSEFLRSNGCDVRVFINSPRSGSPLNLRGYHLMVVVGGDGTFLAGARIASRYGVPVVGVNEGRFGFLTEIEKEEAEDVLREILKGRGKKQRRMMITTFLKRNGRIRRLGDYLNDVIVSKSALARIMEIEVRANGDPMMTVYGDGVIVATPTGSTAYALSAGGPIMYPDSENILFVPICPHTLSNRPVVLPSDFRVSVRVLSGNRACFLTLDGQRGMYLNRGDVVEVLKSKRYCTIYIHPEKTFFEILRTKLRWG